MNTPITDGQRSCYGIRSELLVTKDVARRLETDRAALMEALEDLTKVLVVVAGDTAPVPRIALGYAREALAAARANFPES